MIRRLLILALLFPTSFVAQEEHSHPAPERLGTVSFPTSCQPQTQPDFNRAIALLHSFAYAPAEQAFRNVAAQDPQCAMAHWGIAMTHFHQLWEPPLPPAGLSVAQTEIGTAATLRAGSERERGFIHALGLLLQEAPALPYKTRVANYEAAMGQLAAANPNDVEAQVFYALALLANASPSDRQHLKQKQAVSLLEPLNTRFPKHPGIAHYLIHACDNQELAPRGLAPARAYSKIAPSAPHALHMPSHIFTRLGLWDDSIASNLAARAAAHQQGDTGEELHAMDYLVYAYLQSGRDQEAAQVIQQLHAMSNPGAGDFKVGYAATAMPVRYIVERRQWSDAEKILPPPGSAQPQVAAVAIWARGLGFARNAHPRDATEESTKLHQLADQLRVQGSDYWATQVDIMRREVMAWTAQAENLPDEAITLLRSAADDEDAVEKLPVTPGPIVPAREQLGDLLLQQGKTSEAASAFRVALVNSPGRRGALDGAARATHTSAQN